MAGDSYDSTRDRQPTLDRVRRRLMMGDGVLHQMPTDDGGAFDRRVSTEVATRVREAREGYGDARSNGGITKDEAADLSGIKRGKYLDIEAGSRPGSLSAANLTRIGGALDVDPSWLLTGGDYAMSRDLAEVRSIFERMGPDLRRATMQYLRAIVTSL